MAYTTTTSLPLKMPVPGSREPAQIALLNENAVAVDAHDHTTGKGVAIGRMRSGLDANRPAAGQAGNVYFATDTGKFYVDSGAAWTEFLTTGGTSTITGWTLVDPIIRDTLQFGPEPTGTPDATISRTGTGVLTVDAGLAVTGTISGYGGGEVLFPETGEVQSAISTLHTGTQGYLTFDHRGVGNVGYWMWRNGTGGANTRMTLGPTGTLTLTPDAGQAALVSQGSGSRFLVVPDGANTTTYLQTSDTTSISVFPGNQYFRPYIDNNTHLGGASTRWIAVYAVAGSINTSTQEYKEGITPLDPAACYQAAKDVRWYEFAYQPPPFTPPEPAPEVAYDEHDSNEVKAEKKAARDEAEAGALAAHARMLVETAPARNQRGFVFPTGDAKDEAGGALPPVPDLFGLSDRESTTPQADLATLGAALQHLIAKVEALEAASG